MIQRYDLGEIDGMIPHSDGDYVDYRDHKNAVDELHSQIEDLKHVITDMKDKFEAIKDLANEGITSAKN